MVTRFVAHACNYGSVEPGKRCPQMYLGCISKEKDLHQNFTVGTTQLPRRLCLTVMLKGIKKPKQIIDRDMKRSNKCSKCMGGNILIVEIRCLSTDFLNGRLMAPGTGPPRGDGTCIEAKRYGNDVHGTAMREQGHDEGHGLCRRAQAIEGCPGRGAKGLATLYR